MLVEEKGNRAINKIRQQERRVSRSATLLLKRYVLFILLLMIACMIILIISKFEQTNVPQVLCAIPGHLNCIDFVIGANTLGSRAVLLFSNPQQVALENVSVAIDVFGSGTYSGHCTPAFIPPGSDIVCAINSGSRINPTQVAKGRISATVFLCSQPTAACAGASRQSYNGTFILHVSSSVPSPQCTLTLSIKNSTVYFSTGVSVPIVSNVKVLGYNIPDARVNYTFTGSNTIRVAPTYVNTSSNGSAVSYVLGKTMGVSTVTAKYANCTASSRISSDAPAYVTFNAIGMLSTVPNTSILLSLNNTPYSLEHMPINLSIVPGSLHSYVYYPYPVASGVHIGSNLIYGTCSNLTSPNGIVAAYADCNVIGQYALQYSSTIMADPGEGGTVSPTSGWIDAGTTQNLSESTETGFKCDEWSGIGPGNYSGPCPSGSITINSPITENAVYSLIVNPSVSPASPDVLDVLGSGDSVPNDFNDIFGVLSGPSGSAPPSYGLAGTPPYHYLWSSTCPGFIGSASASFNYTPSASTSGCYFRLSVTDSYSGYGGPAVGNGITQEILVNPALTGKINESCYSEAGTAESCSSLTYYTNETNSNSYVNVSASASGGTPSGSNPPYSYSWYVAPGSSCPNFNNPGGATKFTYYPTDPTGITFICQFDFSATDSAYYPETYTVATKPILITSASGNRTSGQVTVVLEFSPGTAASSSDATVSFCMNGGSTCSGGNLRTLSIGQSNGNVSSAEISLPVGSTIVSLNATTSGNNLHFQGWSASPNVFPSGFSPSNSSQPGAAGRTYGTITGPTAIITSLSSSASTTSIMISCSPSTIAVGASAICSANAEGSTGAIPTGSVNFSTSSAGGSFPNGSQCTLLTGFCSVNYTSSTAGNATITATYNHASSGRISISVTPGYALSVEQSPGDVQNYANAYITYITPSGNSGRICSGTECNGASSIISAVPAGSNITKICSGLNGGTTYEFSLWAGIDSDTGSAVFIHNSSACLSGLNLPVSSNLTFISYYKGNAPPAPSRATTLSCFFYYEAEIGCIAPHGLYNYFTLIPGGSWNYDDPPPPGTAASSPLSCVFYPDLQLSCVTQNGLYTYLTSAPSGWTYDNVPLPGSNSSGTLSCFAYSDVEIGCITPAGVYNHVTAGSSRAWNYDNTPPGGSSGTLSCFFYSSTQVYCITPSGTYSYATSCNSNCQWIYDNPSPPGAKAGSPLSCDFYPDLQIYCVTPSGLYNYLATMPSGSWNYDYAPPPGTNSTGEVSCFAYPGVEIGCITPTGVYNYITAVQSGSWNYDYGPP